MFALEIAAALRLRSTIYMESNFHTGMQTYPGIRYRLQNYNKFTVSASLSIKTQAFKTGTRPRTLQKQLLRLSETFARILLTSFCRMLRR
jgi:hypothetical protein